MRRNTADEVSKYCVEQMLTCFAQVLRDEYGWGGKRILRVLGAVDETFGKILSGELSGADMRVRLEEETGIRIQCDK